MNKEVKKVSNKLTDTTRFVNIFSKTHEIYIDGKKVRTVEPGEEQVMPLFVAENGAKHLADKVLFKKGIRSVNTPSPVRDKILSEILPDIAEEESVEIISDEEFRKKVNEILEKQGEQLNALGGKAKDKDDRIARLEKELKALKVAKKK